MIFPDFEDKGGLLDVTFCKVSASKSSEQFRTNFSLTNLISCLFLECTLHIVHIRDWIGQSYQGEWFYLTLDPPSLILDPWSVILDPWSLIYDLWEKLSGWVVFTSHLGKSAWKGEIELEKGMKRGSQLCKSVCNADPSTGRCKEGTKYPPFKMRQHLSTIPSS